LAAGTPRARRTRVRQLLAPAFPSLPAPPSPAWPARRLQRPPSRSALVSPPASAAAAARTPLEST